MDCIDSKKFTNTMDYNLYFECIYNHRLNVLRERINQKHSRIVSVDAGWIIGTVFKDKEFILEDESGRIVCEGEILSPLITTGMVIGLYGVEKNGVFKQFTCKRIILMKKVYRMIGYKNRVTI